MQRDLLLADKIEKNMLTSYYMGNKLSNRRRRNTISGPAKDIENTEDVAAIGAPSDDIRIVSGIIAEHYLWQAADTVSVLINLSLVCRDWRDCAMSELYKYWDATRVIVSGKGNSINQLAGGDPPVMWHDDDIVAVLGGRIGWIDVETIKATGGVLPNRPLGPVHGDVVGNGDILIDKHALDALGARQRKFAWHHSSVPVMIPNISNEWLREPPAMQFRFIMFVSGIALAIVYDDCGFSMEAHGNRGQHIMVKTCGSAIQIIECTKNLIIAKQYRTVSKWSIVGGYIMHMFNVLR